MHPKKTSLSFNANVKTDLEISTADSGIETIMQSYTLGMGVGFSFLTLTIIILGVVVIIMCKINAAQRHNHE